jgi:hypothetical protein
MTDLSKESNVATPRFIREQDVDDAVKQLTDGQLCRALRQLEEAAGERRFYPLMSAVHREQLADTLARTLRTYTGTSRQKVITDQLRAAGMVVATGMTFHAILQGLAKTNPCYEWQWRSLQEAGGFVHALTDKEIAYLNDKLRNTPEHQIWATTNILIWTTSRSDTIKARYGGVRIICTQRSSVEGVANMSLSLHNVDLRPFVMDETIGGRRKVAGVTMPDLTYRKTVTINTHDQIERGYSRLH